MVKGAQILAFEIKASVPAKLSKGFYNAREDIEPSQTFIVTRAEDTWQSAEGVIHTNLAALPKQLPV
jgi:hypothetical protein